VIRYKTIERERMQDAPFIGCLISAIDCYFNCKGCFNQHLKDSPILKIDEYELLQSVKDNPFEEGIILGGLEWVNQAEEMLRLISIAWQMDLKVMIYTGMDEEHFFNYVRKDIFEGVYIKFGNYDPHQLSDSNVQMGVKLASDNQKIVKY